MDTLMQRGVVDPPGVGMDRRQNPYQQGMFDLMGKAGWLPAPESLRPLSQQSLSTMTAPASTMDAAGNPRITAIEQGVEMKMIFTAENEEAVILGSSGIAPLTYTDQAAITTSSMKFNSHLPDRRPVRGRVRMGTFERKERIGTLSSFGSGIEFPLQFYLDRDGPMFFRLGIEQLNIGVRDFLIMMAYNMLENAIDWSSTLWNDKLKNEGRMAAAGIAAEMWMQREAKLLGLVQRPGIYVMQTMLNFVAEQQFLVDNTTNVALANHRIGKFLQTEIGLYTKQYLAGDAGPRLVNSSPDAALTGMMNVPVHVVKTAAAYDDGTFFDFMTGNRRYGEYVPMLDQHNPTKDRPYRSYWRDTWIYDSNTDDWCCITLAQAIKYSGRFDEKTGRLRSMGDPDAGWMETPSINAKDPFHYDLTNGKLLPKETWGELTEDDLSDDDLVRMARAVLTTHGDELDVTNVTNVTTVLDGFFGAREAVVRDDGDDDDDGDYGDGGYDRRLSQSSGSTRLMSDFESPVPAAAAPGTPAPTFSAADASGAGNGSDAPMLASSQPEIPLGITSEPSQALREQTGTWKSDGRGGFVASGNVSAAPLVRAGLLKMDRSGRLDVTNSDAAAVLAVGADVNYHYNNARDPAGVRNAHHARGQICNILGGVDTTGDAAVVAQRLGSAIGWLTKVGLLPESIAHTQTTSAPRESVMSSLGKSMSELFASESAKALFANASRVKTACAKTQRAAAAITDEDVVARVPVRAAQKPSRPVRIGAETARGVIDSGKARDARQKKLDALASSNSKLKSVLRAYVEAPINLKNINVMIGLDIPVPLTPILMRWEVEMMTAGMILATRGAQRTYYSKPIFSWTDDDAHQVSRGTLSFNAGAFTILENRTYHVRDVLIVGVQSGFDCTFATGGNAGTIAGAKTGDDDVQRGSIVSVLEPYSRAKRWPQLITAYGSWEKLGALGLAHHLKNSNDAHFKGAEFVRAWFGVDPRSAAQPEEQLAAYSGLTEPENLTMWRGGARYYDPVQDRAGDVTSGTGPIASYDFYGPGMGKAWADSTAYPVRNRMATVAQ